MAIASLVERAVSVPSDVAVMIARQADGDARQALNRLDTVASYVLASGRTEVTADDVALVTGSASHRYDRDGDQHRKCTAEEDCSRLSDRRRDRSVLVRSRTNTARTLEWSLTRRTTKDHSSCPQTTPPSVDAMHS